MPVWTENVNPGNIFGVTIDFRLSGHCSRKKLAVFLEGHIHVEAIVPNIATYVVVGVPLPIGISGTNWANMVLLTPAMEWASMRQPGAPQSAGFLADMIWISRVPESFTHVDNRQFAGAGIAHPQRNSTTWAYVDTPGGNSAMILVRCETNPFASGQTGRFMIDAPFRIPIQGYAYRASF
jgi:hypothetical protein